MAKVVAKATYQQTSMHAWQHVHNVTSLLGRYPYGPDPTTTTSCAQQNGVRRGFSEEVSEESPVRRCQKRVQ